MNKERLYFVIGINQNQSYIYKYILASNSKEAKQMFLQKYLGYEIDEIKIISPIKKLINEYERVLENK